MKPAAPSSQANISDSRSLPPDTQSAAQSAPQSPLPLPPNGEALMQRKRRRALSILAAVFISAGLAWAVWWVVVLRHEESTDNAYSAGDAVGIMPQIAGRAASVPVDDTDYVRAGQTLVFIDPVDARLAYERALITLASAVRDVCRLTVELKRGAADIALNRVNVQRMQGNLERRRQLLRENAVRKEEFIHSEEDLASARHSLAAAEAVHAAQSALLLDTPIAEQPSVAAAAAAVRERRLDLERAQVRSAVDGQVVKRSVQVGEYVSPGKPLMAVVPLHALYVNANFKEGQLTKMRIGQPVTLRADMYGGSVTYHGWVRGFSAGTGSVFSLLPPQNATGNWIKVVQRVPVRIELDPQELQKHPLLAGLSMAVTVDTSDQSGPMLLAAPRSETAQAHVANAPNAVTAQRTAENATPRVPGYAVPAFDFGPENERINKIIEENSRDISVLAPAERSGAASSAARASGTTRP